MIKDYKKPSFFKSIVIMWPYIKPYWIQALAAMLSTIPVGSMDALIALALKSYMDLVLIEKTISHTSYIPFLVVLFALAQSSLTYAANYLNTWVGSKITHDVKADLFKKLMSYEASFFDKSTSGEVQFRFNNDVDLACEGLISNTKLFVTRVISFLTLVGVLFYNSWQLAIIAVVVLFVALYPLTTVVKKLKALIGRTIFSEANVVTHYNETFSGNRVVTSYNLADYQSERFKEALQLVFHMAIKTFQRTGIVSPIMYFIVSVGIALVIGMGSHLIVTNEITPGNFLSFLVALLMLYKPVKSLGNNFNSVQMSLMAIGRVNSLMKHVPAITSKKDAVVLNKVRNEICYKAVIFEYTDDQPVLKSIDITVKVGETIALVGNSGGGKTTFVSLLPRFYEVTSGSISIDGMDIRDINLKSLRDNIAMVFQDNFLFAGTIRDNIVLDNSNVSEHDLDKVIKDACLFEFISSLDKGLDTEIGERGILLSGGQKQRLAIARAFLKDAPIVILDEATSALDNKSEAVVQQAIDNLMKDRTVFIVAHRLSTVKNADRIVVINDGTIVEIGTHDSLMSDAGSVYTSLYKTQLIKAA